MRMFSTNCFTCVDRQPNPYQMQTGYRGNAQGYHQQPTPPPPYTAQMSPMGVAMGHQGGQGGQANQMGGPLGQLNQISQLSPINPMGIYGPQQGGQPPPQPQVPPMASGMNRREPPRRRKSAAPYQPSPVASALSPPINTPPVPNLASPYMSIQDSLAYNGYDVKPQIAASTASPQGPGFEDIKPPRTSE